MLKNYDTEKNKEKRQIFMLYLKQIFIYTISIIIYYIFYTNNTC